MGHLAVVVAVDWQQRDLLRRKIQGKDLLQKGTSPYFQYYGTISETCRLLRDSIALG